MVNNSQGETGNQSVSSFSQNAGRMGGNRSKRSDFKGKHSWSISGKDVKSKVKDLLSYIGVFGGVTASVLFLIFMSLTDTRIVGALFGAILASSSYLYRDWNRTSSVITYVDDEGNDKTVSFKKRFAYYMFSAFGTSLIVSSILGLHFVDYDKKKLALYFVVGVIVVYLSRYRTYKISLFRAVDDYLMIFFIFGGFSSIILGGMALSFSPIYGICSIILGFLLTPLCLFFRERSLFKKSRNNTFRKFFSLIVVTSGLAILSIIPLLITHYTFTFPVAVGVGIEGFLLLIGGTLLTEGKTLVSLKDIL